MAVFPDSIQLEYYDGTNWVDISSYVVSNITGEDGFSNDSPENRVAGLGTLQFSLNNVNKYFSPIGGDSERSFSTLTGWKKTAKVRLSVVYDGYSKVIFIGRIDSIDVDDGTWGERQVHVRVNSWMDIPARFPTKDSTLLTNQTFDMAMNNLLSRLPIQPEDTSFEEGKELFPTVFDDTKNKTNALSEMNKLALSELGYIYLKKDGTLILENRDSRNGVDTLTTIPISPSLSTLLISEASDFIVTEAGDYIVLDESEDNPYYNSMIGMDLNYDKIINKIQLNVYPRDVGTSNEVLFKIGQPITIAGLSTITLDGRYTDPTGGATINGKNMVTPASGTDYTMNTLSDGTGTDKTANLTVTAEYYTDGVKYTLVNTFGEDAYITKLQARGQAIRIYNQVSKTIENTTSEDNYGDNQVTLDQKYKANFYSGEVFSKGIIYLNSYPRTIIDKVDFLANENSSHMMSFLHLDIGDLIMLYENRIPMSNYHRIIKRMFTITLGGIILFTFLVSPSYSYGSTQYSPLTLRFNGGTSKDAINYGYLPRVSNLTSRSISFWIYQNSNPAGVEQYTFVGYGRNYLIYTNSAKSLRLYQITTGPGNVYPVWEVNGALTSTAAWYHIVITHEIPYATPPIAPKMYINGVAQTVAVVAPTGVGYPGKEDGLDFVIGNNKASNNDYQEAFDGWMKDVRVYNKILTQDEVTTIYNNGSQDYYVGTDNMIFQSFFTHRDNGTSFTLDGTTLTSTFSILDNCFNSIGTPSGSVVVDAP